MTELEKLSQELVSKTANQVLDEVQHILDRAGGHQMAVEKADEDDAFAQIKADVLATNDPEKIALVQKFEELLDTVDQKHRDIILNERNPALAELRAKYTQSAAVSQSDNSGLADKGLQGQ